VGAETGEYDRAAFPGPRAAPDDARLHPLVADPARVRGLHRVDRAREGRRIGIDDRAPRALGAVPTLVAVHRPIPSLDRRDGTRDLWQELERAAWRHVASVQEGVDRDTPGALALRELDDGVQVGEIGVHAAGRDEA